MAFNDIYNIAGTAMNAQTAGARQSGVSIANSPGPQAVLDRHRRQQQGRRPPGPV